MSLVGKWRPHAVTLRTGKYFAEVMLEKLPHRKVSEGPPVWADRYTWRVWRGVGLYSFLEAGETRTFAAACKAAERALARWRRAAQ